MSYGMRLTAVTTLSLEEDYCCAAAAAAGKGGRRGASRSGFPCRQQVREQDVKLGPADLLNSENRPFRVSTRKTRLVRVIGVPVDLVAGEVDAVVEIAEPHAPLTQPAPHRHTHLAFTRIFSLSCTAWPKSALPVLHPARPSPLGARFGIRARHAGPAGPRGLGCGEDPATGGRTGMCGPAEVNEGGSRRLRRCRGRAGVEVNEGGECRWQAAPLPSVPPAGSHILDESRRSRRAEPNKAYCTFFLLHILPL